MGVFIAKPFSEYTLDDYEHVVRVNVGGFFHVTQRVIEPMLKQGTGHIVSVTTTLLESAYSGLPSVLASLTKGGVAAATKSLAIEYAGRGIRVNAVSPGMILTPLQGDATPEQLARFHPINKAGTVEDVARGVFHPRGRDPRPTNLTLVFRQIEGAWLIEHYHVSLVA